MINIQYNIIVLESFISLYVICDGYITLVLCYVTFCDIYMWYHTNFLKLPIYYIEHVSNYSSYFITILNITKEKKNKRQKTKKTTKVFKTTILYNIFSKQKST